MRIIYFPHPTLRHVSKPLKRVDAEVHRMARDMLDLMYQARGIGLAANQVDLPYRMFVLNITGNPAETQHERVFINPVITARKGMAEAEEGCLSLPEVYADVMRPEKVTLTSYNLQGEEVNETLDGLAARAVQHEIDHLDGVLFIDRLSPTSRLALKEVLAEFELQFTGQRERGEMPNDQQIAQRLAELEGVRA